MRAMTLEMPTSDVATPQVRSPRATSGEDHTSPAGLVTGDGKTLHQETFDSARAAGIAVLTAAAMALAILTGLVMLLVD